MRKFHVIDGGIQQTPKSARQRTAKPGYMAQCIRCGGRESFVTKIGVMIKNGKPTGGTARLLCVACHRNGTVGEMM